MESAATEIETSLRAARAELQAAQALQVKERAGQLEEVALGVTALVSLLFGQDATPRDKAAMEPTDDVESWYDSGVRLMPEGGPEGVADGAVLTTTEAIKSKKEDAVKAEIEARKEASALRSGLKDARERVKEAAKTEETATEQLALANAELSAAAEAVSAAEASVSARERDVQDFETAAAASDDLYVAAGKVVDQAREVAAQAQANLNAKMLEEKKVKAWWQVLSPTTSGDDSAVPTAETRAPPTGQESGVVVPTGNAMPADEAVADGASDGGSGLKK